MKRQTLHAQRTRPYEIEGVAWTLCLRNVYISKIAAFEDGVTCRACRKVIEFYRECEEDRRIRARAKQEE